jgi:hypothetical protein
VTCAGGKPLTEESQKMALEKKTKAEIDKLDKYVETSLIYVT